MKRILQQKITMTKYFMTALLGLMAFASFGQCPPPSCPTGNCYCISDNTVTDQSGTLYDDGGPGRDYRAGEEELTQVITYLFNIEPAGAPDTIALEFTQFDVEASGNCEYDHLEVLDGAISLGIFCGNDNPGVLVATSGAVTIRWFSDPNAVRPGFEMNWFVDSVPDAAPPTTGGPTTDGHCEPVIDPACSRGVAHVVVREIDNNTGEMCDPRWDFRDQIAYFQPADDEIMELDFWGYFVGDTYFVYIDYNQDDAFTSADIYFTNQIATSANVPPELVPLVIPPTAEPGAIRMRIYYDWLGQGEPCFDPFNGEYEDYTLMIEGDLPRCAQNGYPDAINVCTDAVISWDANPVGENATSYILFAREAGASEYFIDSVEVFGTSYDYPGYLPDSTTIEWHVLPKNANGIQEGCSNVKWSFTTGAHPTAVKFIPDSLELCTFTDVAMDPNPTGGGVNSYAEYTHEWTGNGVPFLNRTDTSGVVFNSNTPGNYTLYYRALDLNGCSEIDSVAILVKASPTTGVISGTPEACFGDSLTVMVTGAIGNLQWQDSITNGMWTNLDGEMDSSITVYADVDGLFRVIVEQEGCVDSTDAFATTVNSLPDNPTFSIASVNGDFYVCDNMTVELSSSNYGGTDSLLWNSDTLSAPSYMVENSGYHSVLYTDPNGCQSEDSVFVERYFIDKPPVFYPYGDAQLCTGDTIQYKVVNYLDNLTWMDATTGQYNTFDQSTSDIYVTYRDDRGCEINSDTVEVRVVSTPEKPVITVSPSTEVCLGDSVTLEVTNYTNNLFWNDSAQTIGSILKFEAGQIRDYSFLVRFLTENCEAFETVQVTSNPTPGQPTLDYGTMGDLVASIGGMPIYNWLDSNGVLVTQTVDNSFTPSVSGYYSVTVTNEYGCESIPSEPFFYDKTLSIQNNLGNNSFNVFPNPSSGKVFIQGENLKELNLKVFDLVGRVIPITPRMVGENGMELELNQSGTYIIIGQTPNGKMTNHRIVVQ